MDSHKIHKAFIQMAKQFLCLVHVQFPLAIYVKDILSWGTETNSNRIIEIVQIEVGKDQTISKTNHGFLNYPKKWTKLACWFFGRIEDNICK